jgi:hypothetical protein
MQAFVSDRRGDIQITLDAEESVRCRPGSFNGYEIPLNIAGGRTEILDVDLE